MTKSADYDEQVRNRERILTFNAIKHAGLKFKLRERGYLTNRFNLYLVLVTWFVLGVRGHSTSANKVIIKA